MNYNDTVNWMFRQLPMYQNKGAAAYKADLSNTLNLARHLKFPEKKFKSVHIAGTNGKGSTSHMIASVLQEAGYKVGLYTSPHLKDFRERIKINGKCVSKQFVIQFIKSNRSFFENNALSFFEMTVGMAFDYFAKKKVDIAIIEVGLGGRLDSTNILRPEVSVITNIGLDHTKFLGSSLREIAKEKGGIIKPKIPVVIGETQTNLKPIFDAFATMNDVPVYYADKAEFPEIFKTDLQGSYQQKNIKTARQTIEILNTKGYKVTTSKLRTGFLNVVANTGLMGRWQIIEKQPKIICDIAHNKEGLILVMDQLLKESFNNLHIVIGFVNDKDINAICPLFPKEAQYYFCKPKVERCIDALKLKAIFNEKKYKGEAYTSVNEALESAKKNAGLKDLIYVGGSTFVVAEAL